MRGAIARDPPSEPPEHAGWPGGEGLDVSLISSFNMKDAPSVIGHGPKRALKHLHAEGPPRLETSS